MEETKGNHTSHGHLCTKSSVFHPTQLGAGGQQEIFRHMKRHYDRLERVTPATDTSPPTSYKRSTLARDRARKFQSVDNFKLPVTSRFIEQIRQDNEGTDLISLPTKDSDIQSLLRHVPELRKAIKYRSDSHSSLDTKDLEELADSREEGEVQKESRESVFLQTPGHRKREKSPNKNMENVRMNLPGNENDTELQNNMEMQYLQFVSNITREILTSGVSSDRALNMLFERHIAQRKGALNECVMRRKVEELKMKLNITS